MLNTFGGKGVSVRWEVKILFLCLPMYKGNFADFYEGEEGRFIETRSVTKNFDWEFNVWNLWEFDVLFHFFLYR